MLRELLLFKMLTMMLCIVLLVLLAVWAYRYVQYRRAVRSSQMRWLHFEASKAYAEVEAHQALEWPTSSSMLNQSTQLLSPIPEEHGRDSLESMSSARRDARVNAASFVSYGSVEMP